MIKILGVNDFHGQISAGRFSDNRPVGSAPILAAYLRQAEKEAEGHTLFALIGDQVGASGPSSSLLNDEPSILFFNTLTNAHCNKNSILDARCNIVATIGNHEFDKGKQVMFDLIFGTDKPPTDSWIPLPHYPGAVFPYISANIVDADTNKPLFPPYVIKQVAGVPIAFIGAIFKNAPATIKQENIKGIKFLDEIEAINRYIPEIKGQGVHIIIVLLHEGGNQTPYEGDTREDTEVQGDIINFVQQLDDAVDVVMAGHTHQFLNAFLLNQHGVKILVTQAKSYSSDFAEVTLLIDPKNLSVIKKSAQIVTTFADQGPGTFPDEKAQKLVQLAEEKVNPIINQYVGTSETNLTKIGSPAGESNLGNLIADAFRNRFHADMAFIGPHSFRNDLLAGKITWGMLYSVLPFANDVVKLTLTGDNIYEILEQQWVSYTRILQISGITYSYDLTKPLGQRIVSVYQNNQPLQREKTYTVAADDFLVMTTLKKGQIIERGERALDVLINYIKDLPQPFSATIEGRIKQVS